MSVRIERIYGDNVYDDDGITTAVALMVDDEQVQIGRFGGEPEDNVECRDYAWVIPMLQKSIEAERLRCAQICADRAAMLEATADQYPAGTAVCFAAEARECERRIRGEK